jgi:hypothetical protein
VAEPCLSTGMTRQEIENLTLLALQRCRDFSQCHGMSARPSSAHLDVQMTIAYIMRYQQLPLAEAYALCLPGLFANCLC